MYSFSKISKRNVKSHREYNKQIVKGTRFICISNGTIGRGARHINIPLELLLSDFSLDEIKKAYKKSREKETSSIDHKYEIPF